MNNDKREEYKKKEDKRSYTDSEKKQKRKHIVRAEELRWEIRELRTQRRQEQNTMKGGRRMKKRNKNKEKERGAATKQKKRKHESEHGLEEEQLTWTTRKQT